eukprot:7186774-Prorocentrum_lima.AAC.1
MFVRSYCGATTGKGAWQRDSQRKHNGQVDHAHAGHIHGGGSEDASEYGVYDAQAGPSRSSPAICSWREAPGRAQSNGCGGGTVNQKPAAMYIGWPRNWKAAWAVKLSGIR